jgi:uncharacterized delta-60 repeat protein
MRLVKMIAIVFTWLAIAYSQTERWVYRYNGPGDYDDEAYSLVYGADGYIYSVGYSSDSPIDKDFTVISLMPTCSQRWVYRYNGPDNGDDEAKSIVYGLDGNIYAAGYSRGSGTSWDFTVVSLASTGNERWVYRYNNPGYYRDEANSVAYGADGNIYAAGYSSGIRANKDFTIISLTPTGTERWVYRYNGSGNLNDAAYSLVCGEDGNIYAAGYSTGTGTNLDFTIISLTLDGTERWVYRYNGPGNLSDEAYSLAFGRDGNIYTAGWCFDSTYGYDLTIISLTTTGTERWNYRYNGPANEWDKANSLIYGADGNIYVAGYSRSINIDEDYIVLSLTPAGTERWVYRYNGPEYCREEAFSLVFGEDSNIYAAGYTESYETNEDFTVISLTSSGTERWVYQYNGPGNDDDLAYSVVYGIDGNIYIAGMNNRVNNLDFTVIGLTATGNQLWVYRYNGPGGAYIDYANCLTYGTDGNIYAAGESCSNATESDFTVVSLTKDGIERWVYRATEEFDDEANSIVYGDDGNIYAAGTSYRWRTHWDFIVISLAATGTERWVYRYDGPMNDEDYAHSIVYGLDGNIYVSGESRDSITSHDFVVISLTANGIERWVYRYNGLGNGNDGAYSLVYGVDGNLYAAGRSYGIDSTGDFTVISLTLTGTERWVYQYNESTNYYSESNSIIYGNDGNIYAAGWSCVGSGTDDIDIVVISLTTTGAERWVYRYNGPGDNVDYAFSLVYGEDGNIYVAGRSVGNGTGFDFVVISLTSTGNERWVYRYNTSANNNDGAYSLVYGLDDNVYAAGWSVGIGGDFTVISLTSTGTERWVYRYNGPGNSNDLANSIVYGLDGNIYAAGYCNSETWEDFTVISINPAIGIEEEYAAKRNPESGFHISFGTFQNQNLDYTLSLPEPATVKLSLYSLSGQRMLDWQVNTAQGTHRYIRGLPNLRHSVYFLIAEVLGKGFKDSKKLIVTK